MGVTILGPDLSVAKKKKNAPGFVPVFQKAESWTFSCHKP